MRQVGMLDWDGEMARFRADVRRGLDAVLDHHRFVLGPEVEELERTVAAYCQCRRGVAVSSGTDALLATLMALEVGPGDEVITTPFTFFATAGSIHRVGARPVFVDIEPDTFNLDVSQIEVALTSKTRVILPVHLFGQCADIDDIRVIADRRGIAVVEDAAHALGATYRGRRAGSLGTAACLSFYPTKNLAAFGDAGMVVTNDEALADRLVKVRNHGETQRYHHAFVGGNFRLDSFQGAVLLAKFRALEEFNAKRQANAARYDALLADAPVQTPPVRDYNVSVYHQYSILGDQRDALAHHLRECGVATGVYYPVPLHLQECFADSGYKKGQFPRCENTCERVLSLPIHPLLTSEDLEYVAARIVEFYARSSAS